MELKDRIKQLREEKGLNLTQLAVQFDLKEAGVRAWELGRTKPGADTLIKLAQYFNCTTDYLLGLSNHKNIEEKKELDKFIDLIKKGLSSLDEPYLDTTKNCIENIFKILNRSDITGHMALLSTFSVNELVSGINVIMDTMAKARSISRYDSIIRQNYDDIVCCIMDVYNMKLRVQSNLAFTFKTIIDRPSSKIKKALEDAGYDTDFIVGDYFGSLDEFLSSAIEEKIKEGKASGEVTDYYDPKE